MRSNYKPRFYIFEPSEISIILALLGSSLLFSFTLGVHYTKKLIHAGTNESQAAIKEKTTPAKASLEVAPSPVEIKEQTQNINQSLDDSIKKNLHDEVEKVGIKLKSGRQINLPKATKKSNGGATTLNQPSVESPSSPDLKNTKTEQSKTENHS